MSVVRIVAQGEDAPIIKNRDIVEKSKLLAALEANIENDWKEIDIGVFDQLLVELERGGRITTAERQSLLLKLGLKKIREESQGSGEEGENADPLQP